MCSSCGERFRYVYSMLAHVRFRCTRLSSPVASSPRAGSIRELPSPSDAYASDSSDASDRRSLKRKSDSDVDVEDHVPKVVCVEENNNETATSSHRSPSPTHDNSDVGSAFRKVERTNPNILSSPIPGDSVSSASSSRLSDVFVSAAPSGLVKQFYNKSLVPSNAMSTRFLGVGFGMMMPNWMIPKSVGQSYMDTRMYSERFQTAHVSKSDIMQSLPSPMTVLTQDAIRSFPNGEMLSKQILMEQLRKSQLPCMQTGNPMVEKLLQTSTTPAMLQRPIQQLNLAQNWCAKCNATFRMTSDLVYHMRSHHKREFDPIKRKRDDKLQCDVCKETFKERHHLTRHMTSHS